MLISSRSESAARFWQWGACRMLILLGIFIPLLTQAQEGAPHETGAFQVNICDWTLQVREAVVAIAKSQVASMVTADVAAEIAAAISCVNVSRSHIESLTTLILNGRGGGGRITTVRAEDFEEMPNLQVLDLGANRLAELPQFPHLGELRHLFVQENQLGDLPINRFITLVRLEMLALQGNRLVTLERDTFRGLGRLSELFLQDNLLDNLPADVFARLGGLERLFLSGNRLSGLHESVFQGLPRLRSLYLSGNRLVTLPQDIFTSSGRLGVLDLSRNALTRVPDLSGLHNLHTLLLNANELAVLSADIFAGLRLDELRLADNPGAPFVFTLALERVDNPDPLASSPATVRAALTGNVPFSVTLNLDASAGALSSSHLVIPAGGAVSNTVTVTHPTRMVLSIVSDDQLSVPPGYDGMELIVDAPLTLFSPVPATVIDVRISSTPSSMQTYLAAEIIRVEVEFDQDVVAHAEAPELVLRIGAEQRTATYVRDDSTSHILRFQYTVDATDSDADGISIAGSALHVAGLRTIDGESVESALAGHALDDADNHKVAGDRNRAPMLYGDADLEFVENSVDTVTVFVARDLDVAQQLNWLLAGADVNAFSVEVFADGSAAALLFRTPPDFETPVDADGDNVYMVDIRVADNGVPPELAVFKSQVRILNQQEIANDIGVVQLSWTGQFPRIAEPVQAQLRELDQGVTEHRWHWELNGAMGSCTGTWTVLAESVSMGTTASYAPLEEHHERCIRAVVDYRDEHGAARAATASLPLRGKVILRALHNSPIRLVEGESILFNLELHTQPAESVLSRTLALVFRVEEVPGYLSADAEDYILYTGYGEEDPDLRTWTIPSGTHADYEHFYEVPLSMRVFQDESASLGEQLEAEERLRIIVSGQDADGGALDIDADGLEVSIAASDPVIVRLAGDQRVHEGGVATYTVLLSTAVKSPLRISYSTAHDTTAVAPDDYLARVGTLVFMPGDMTRQTVEVHTVDDAVSEEDEALDFSIAIESGFAELSGAPKITTTILNDDSVTGVPPRIVAQRIGALVPSSSPRFSIPEAGVFQDQSDSVNILENIFPVSGYFVDEVEGDVPTYWLLSGADAALFELSTAIGDRTELRFRSAPDFETPLDSAIDNVYQVTLQATAGKAQLMHVVVNVRDMEESTLHVTSNGASVGMGNPPVQGMEIVAELRNPEDLPEAGSMASWTWSVLGPEAAPQLVLFTETSALPAGAASAQSRYTPDIRVIEAGTGLTLRLEYRNTRGVQVLHWATTAPGRIPLPRATLTAVSLPFSVATGRIVGGEAAVLTWRLPEDTDRQLLTRMDYRWSAGTDAVYGAWLAVPRSRLNEENADGYTVFGLQNGIRYFFQVRAVSASSTGEPSVAAQMVPVGVPRAPVLEATAGDGQVLLTWSLTEEGQNGGVPSGWEYSGGSSRELVAWTPVPDSGPGAEHATGYAVTGLSNALVNGVVHRFSVRAVNSAGAGLASAVVLARPVQNAPFFTGAAAGFVVWYQNTPVRLVLPEPMGGDGQLRVTLEGALPAGVTRRGGLISGMPTAIMETTAYVYRVQDMDGDIATWPLSLSVLAAPAGSLLYMQETFVTVAEGEQVDVGLRVSPPLAETLHISWRLLPGSAGPDDYRDVSGGTLIMSPNQSTAQIQVEAVEDVLAEGNEGFVVELQAAAAVTLGTSTTAIRIVASDPLTVSLTGPDTVDEGAVARYTVRLSGARSTEAVRVMPRLDTTIAVPEDVLSLPELLTLSPGVAVATFDLATVADNLIEDDGQLRVTLLDGVAGGAGRIVLHAVDHTVSTVVVDRSAPMISGPEAPDFIAGQLGSVAAYRAVDTNGDVVRWSLAGIDAERFEILSIGGILSFRTAPDYANPDDANMDRIYELQLIAEDDGEPSAQAMLPVRVRLLAADASTVTAAFDATLYIVTEGGSTATVMVELSAVPNRAVAIPVLLESTKAEAADWRVSGLSGSPGNYTLDFSTTGTRQSFTVTAVDDNVVEGAEHLSLRFARLPAGVSPGSVAAAVLNILDNDSAQIRIVEFVVNVAEPGQADFMVEISAEIAAMLTVDWFTVDGTAMAPGDYPASGSGSIVFPAGSVANAQQPFSVPINDDRLAETAEHFSVSLGTVTSPLAAQLTVDTVPAMVHIAPSDPFTVTLSPLSGVLEGTAAVYTVTLSGGEPEAAVTVDWSTADAGSGTVATAGADYVQTGGTLIFMVAANFADQMIRVQTMEDTLYDPDESFQVVLSNLQGGGGAPAMLGMASTTTIVDNDMQDRVIVAWEQPAYTVSEMEPGVELCAALSEGVLSGDRTLELVYETQDDTAMAATDYITAAGTLTLSVSNTSACAMVLLPADNGTVNGERTFNVVLTAATGMPGMDVDATLGTAATAAVTITDDDETVVSLVGLSDEMDEGGNAGFMVSLSAPVASELAVVWSTVDGTAEAPGDYMMEDSGTVVFAAHTTTQSFNVAVVDDNLSELAENFTVRLGAAMGSLAGRVTVDMNPVVVTIAENDPITVVLSGVGSVDEGDAAVYTVTLSGGAPATDMTVRYATDVVLSGTSATAGTDYAAAGGILTFRVTDFAPRMITILTLDDSRYDPGESFRMVLSNPQGGGGVTPELDTAMLVTGIADNDMQDQITAGWVQPTYAVTETATRVELCATLSTGVLSGMRAVRLNYVTRNGTAVAGRDYTSRSGMLRLSAAARSACAMVPLPGNNDTVNEERTFDVVLTGVQGIPNPNVDATLGTATATVTITDDDEAVVSLVGPSDEMDEGGNAGFMVSLSAPVASELAVVWSTTDGTAEAPGDYMMEDSGTVVFAANTTTRSFDVAVVDDDLSELAESFMVSLGAATGSLAGRVTVDMHPVVVTIAENDPIRVELSGTDSVVEGAEAVYTATLSGGIPMADVTVEYATMDAASGTTAMAGVDYTTVDSTLTFTAVTSFADRMIRISTLEDALYDPAESFQLVLGNLQGGGGASVPPGTASITTTIADNDMQDQVTVGWAQADYTVSETVTGVELCAVLSAGTLSGDRTLALAYATQDGTATADDDYTAATGTLTLQAGEVQDCVAVSLSAEDSIENSARAFRAVLTAATGMPGTDVVATLGVAIATVTITDDESPTVLLRWPLGMVAEGGTAGFSVILSAPVATELRVPWSTADGTAVAPGDYVAAMGTVVFAANMTTAQSFTVAVEDDNFSELAESFTVSLGAATGSPTSALTVDTSPVMVTIAENDPIRVELSGMDSVAEGAEAVYTATLSGGVPTADVTVEYATTAAASGTTATAGIDYMAVDGTLTFTAATNFADRMIRVQTLPDPLYEASAESFRLVLGNPLGGGGATPVLGIAMAVTMITDDDMQDQVTAGWESAAYTVSESESGVELCVALSVGNTLSDDRMLALTYEARDDTAVAGTDYTADPGTLTLRAGDSRACVAVELSADDGAVNRARVFNMVLTGATGIPDTDVVAVLGVDTATVTIADNDSATVSLIGPSGTVAEGDTAEFMVSLSASVADDLVVAWSVTDGTAVASGDYVAEGSGSVMFPANVTTVQSFTVSMVDDNLSELAEDLTVGLGTATGSLVGRVTVDPTLLTVTIVENDPITVSLSGADSVTEGDAAVYTVALSGGEPTAAVMVTWSTADAGSGTAAAGLDYTAVMGLLTFTALDLVPRMFSIQTTADTLYDPGESFQLVLSNLQGGGGPPATFGTAQVTTMIADDDMQDEVTVGWEQAGHTESEAESRVRLCAGLSVGALSGSRTLELAYETRNGTAAAGTDYTVATGTLTLSTDGPRACVEVMLSAEDAVINRARTFSVVLTRATGMPGMDVVVVLGPITSAVVTITDNDDTVEFTGDTSVGVADASVFYYALALGDVLGRSDRDRQAVLGRYIPDDVAAQAALSKIEALVREEGPSVVDVTDDGVVDLHDAVVFYYALSLPGALGNGDSGGHAALRQQILGPFLADRYGAGAPVPDSVLQTMLRRANALRK